ncbi:hypothetical protein GCK32_006031 [Trichostrongylus colubriformis]|uniref:DUF5641 domain-containing protein n=1 Tax=Trichostrongylus colubriformis TaxID=6319 RepID=A0AAN8G5Z4_TRICO
MPSTRRAFLLGSSRCLNCGSKAHRVAACTVATAANVTKGTIHRPAAEVRITIIHRTPNAAQRQPLKPTVVQPAKSKHNKPAKQHVVIVEEDPLTQKGAEEAIVLQMGESQHEAQGKVILLVGSARIADSKNSIREATVLLDTGSELSFIREDSAQELALPVVENASLSISTFGTPILSVRNCNITNLTIHDIEGGQHELRLFRSQYITRTIEQADLNQADLDFITHHGIVLSLKDISTPFQPQIFLGCDYLWTFMMPMGKLTLPSGLQLIPTKFGYIISGWQPQEAVAAVTTLTTLNLKTEKDTWDRYWSLESSCTDEYTGSKHTELQQTNEMVLQTFPNTVERRCDRNYVRLPWKSNCYSLPDNKMIALKRPQGAKVVHFIYSALSQVIEMKRVFFFTDSEFALGWISLPDRQTAGVLVANRLKEIRNIFNDLEAQGTTIFFGYIATSSNPADCATRGLTSSSCQEHFWWKGPQIVHVDVSQTPTFDRMFPLVKKQEETTEDDENEIVLDFPFEYANERGGDTTYHTLEEAQQLATQRRVEEALKSEHHKFPMDNKRGSDIKPVEGSIFLLWDAVQPRNTWKIGRIVELRRNMSDTSREVVVELPNKQRIRRPVNKIVPLEITKDAQPTHAGSPSTTSLDSSVSQQRYNLRRIYLTPNDDFVYDNFRSTRWRSSVQLEITTSRVNRPIKIFHFNIITNQPRLVPPAIVTLSSVSTPPVPLLNSLFITDGTHTSIAPSGYLPPLRCSSPEQAANMTCDVVEDCKCTPAEVKMLCECQDLNLTAHMTDPEHQIPIIRPNVEFRMQSNLIARIPSLPTAEIIVRVKDELQTTALTSDAVCKVKNSECTGCYNCAKGARAGIVCTSSTPEERGEIQCNDHRFTVPCSSHGTPSELRFTST